MKMIVALQINYDSRQHCVKKVRIWKFFGPHFPAFGLNMEIYRVISPNAGKYRTEKLQI